MNRNNNYKKCKLIKIKKKIKVKKIMLAMKLANNN